ncbi:MAG: YdcF family protein [Rhodospirillales bacterium]|nr:YdcF family protein [Rhodospirillales bacterium]
MAAAAAVRGVRRAGRVLLLLTAAWIAGFVWFVGRAERPAPEAPHARGIVALTGGVDRVRTALRLLAAGDGRELLVSGIGGGAELGDLGRRAGFDPAPLAARITLGRGAASTYGNAREAAVWARARGVRSLILVTAYYHMPRALVEFRRALPWVRLVAYPVYPPGLRGAAKWRLLSEEFMKYLAARAGLTRLFPGPAPRLRPAVPAGRAG